MHDYPGAVMAASRTTATSRRRCQWICEVDRGRLSIPYEGSYSTFHLENKAAPEAQAGCQACKKMRAELDEFVVSRLVRQEHARYDRYEQMEAEIARQTRHREIEFPGLFG